MKPDDFEQKLQRQPLRQIPAEWREEILVAADVNRRKSREFIPPSGTATVMLRFRQIFWPSPVAWAGLAAIWVLILAVDFSTRDKSPVVAGKSAPPSPEILVELRQQQRMLAELIGPRDAREADRSKSFVPQPRSERVEILTG